MTTVQEIACSFAFWQPAWGSFPAMDFYNLKEPIPSHPMNSTVSRQTIEKAGYAVPEAEAAKALEARKA